MRSRSVGGEVGLAVKYTLVAGLGFVTDISVLQLGVWLGLSPAVARAISLFAAMQATFLANGLLVFRCLDRRRAPMQWFGYMATNGFGNLCNYLVFTTLLSLHRPIVSDRLFAVMVGSVAAWLINYLCARLVVFRRGARAFVDAQHAATCATTPLTSHGR